MHIIVYFLIALLARNSGLLLYDVVILINKINRKLDQNFHYQFGHVGQSLGSLDS